MWIWFIITSLLSTVYYVILLICFVPRQRRVEYLCLVLSLASQLARGVCARALFVSHLAPHAWWLFSLAYNLLSFILTYTSTCPSGGPSLARICVATLVARCCTACSNKTCWGCVLESRTPTQLSGYCRRSRSNKIFFNENFNYIPTTQMKLFIDCRPI